MKVVVEKLDVFRYNYILEDDKGNPVREFSDVEHAFEFQKELEGLKTGDRIDYLDDEQDIISAEVLYRTEDGVRVRVDYTDDSDEPTHYEEDVDWVQIEVAYSE